MHISGESTRLLVCWKKESENNVKKLEVRLLLEFLPDDMPWVCGYHVDHFPHFGNKVSKRIVADQCAYELSREVDSVFRDNPS